MARVIVETDPLRWQYSLLSAVLFEARGLKLFIILVLWSSRERLIVLPRLNISSCHSRNEHCLFYSESCIALMMTLKQLFSFILFL